MQLPSVRSKPRMLAASGQRVNTRQDDNDYTRRTEMPWQRQALALYDAVPELHYAGQFFARMLSKVRIFPALLNSPDSEHPKKIEDGIPVEILNRIQDPGGGHSQLLFRYGQLQFITGDGYLLGRGLDQGQGSWSFVWRDELKFENGIVTHLLAPNMPPKNYNEIPDNAYAPVSPGSAVAYRMWTPHPRAQAWPDAPMRAVLEIGEELLILTKSVHSTATSRLARAPLLKMPIEIMPPPVDAEGDEDPENDPFQADFTEYLEYAIENPSSAGASSPYVLWAAYDYLDRIDKIELHNPATDYVERDLRAEAVKRLGYSLDMPPEALTGFASSNHWCNDTETFIFIKGKGFCNQSELSIGDIILTLNHITGESEWQPVDDIYRADVVDEPMWLMESAKHSSLSTAKHRWPIIKVGHRVSGSRRRWTTSEDGFSATDRIPVAAVLAEGQTPTETKHSDDFVRLVVAYSADGTNQAHGNIRICKFADDEIDELRRILTSVYGENGFREHDHPTHTADGTAFVLRQAEAALLLDICDEFKAIPIYFVEELTQNQLQIFLDSTVEIGDGVIDTGGANVLYQVEPSRIQAFAYAAQLSGFVVTSGVRNQQTGFGTRPLSWVRWSSKRLAFQPWKCDVEVLPYTGTVWCPTTKNGTWLAQRNGKAFFTGNSAAAIMDAIWNDHGDPKMKQFCHDIADMYLRPSLQQAGYADWENVTVWYDATEVVMNPDRSDDANEAWDRGAIGYTGFRRMKAIPESYAQTDDEHSEWLETKLVRVRESQMMPSQADKNPSLGPPGSPKDVIDVRQGKKTVVASGQRELGAADLAILRCREMAGIRLRRLKTCPSCLEAATGQPAAMVAALVGAEGVQQLGVTNTRELVKGGGDQYRSLLTSWGYTASEAEVLSQMVEVHASRTLFEQHLPSMPPGFAAHVERTKESI